MISLTTVGDNLKPPGVYIYLARKPVRQYQKRFANKKGGGSKYPPPSVFNNILSTSLLFFFFLLGSLDKLCG